jgi:putative phosphoribosyl transferase
MRMFKNRQEAAHLLAQELRPYRQTDALVIALPRGGVPLGAIIAQELHLPLDIILIKKIGHPSQPEYAIGAVSMNSRVINPKIDLPTRYFDEQTELIRAELAARYDRYSQGYPPLPVAGKTVILVDDGIATGYTMLAAAQLLRQAHAARILVAVPVAPPRASQKMGAYADDFICLQTPPDFQAVGQFYQDFSEVSHEEVVRLLAEQRQAEQFRQANREPGYLMREEVEIPLDTARLAGNLQVPEKAGAVVIFSHGSGSSRHSSRNRYVARVLEEKGFATLLFDLLTEAEDALYQNRFNIELLTQRLILVTKWLATQEAVQHLPVGYFGASTGAASALGAAANLGGKIKAVVSRGGRPDLALAVLPQVTAATLLLVGGRDEAVLGLNRQAYDRLSAPRDLVVVPGASHLFEEAGKLEEMAHLAADWFSRYLH